MDYVDRDKKMATLRRGYKIGASENKARQLKREAIVLMIVAVAIIALYFITTGV